MSYKFPYIDGCNTMKLCNAENIIIWGAGKIGKLTLNRIRELGLKVFAFCDSNIKLQGKSFAGLRIISPNELKGHETVVIASKYLEEIKKELIEMKISSVLPAHLFFNGITLDTSVCNNNMHALTKLKRQLINSNFMGEEKITLNSIDVVITEKCSLKCKDCANLMQYFEQPEHESFEVVISALDKIMAAVDFIYEIRILGGEPYMNKQLHQYIDRIVEYKNYGDIIVYTNGTIVPTDDNLQCLKKENIFLSISNYGKVSNRIEEIEGILKYEGIMYDIKKIDSWQNCGHIEYFNRNEQENKTVFNECCCNNLFAIRHGKLFGCPFSGNAYILKAIPDFSNDYIKVIDMVDIDIIRNCIKALKEKDYYQACKYCAGRPLEGAEIEPAIQIDKPIKWKVRNNE